MTRSNVPETPRRHAAAAAPPVVPTRMQRDVHRPVGQAERTARRPRLPGDAIRLGRVGELHEEQHVAHRAVGRVHFVESPPARWQAARNRQARR